ncbi:phytanoyl-CoA dioxygenase family protein [Paenibacillus macquariensis]|uniref:Phytanoyl-CoA hydroxylase n=1 Tax=Paenibacillus macquariensis TaxID=948756 RepID=A0ABY1KC58_9BACL|nr:phytanoyl-CoA dioxygenase family protein [Paenibacillus macquariensis]MEC0089607.1 phytanoyl-CoA dioxygenase family protein [Paenibacillus macquariensis]OAB30901.1 phytanoyl-CoA dioxygenase [Paenibacillus macquariensis subsp. macquariensis]SIR58330.1 phytanoyl-CoA hydroxylase [Paenibacillus macquariensis]
MNGNYTKPLTPLTDSQVEFFREQGYFLFKKGMTEDLIDAFNGHIYDIRNQDPIPVWASCDKNKKYSVRLFNPHKNDSFSQQLMKHAIVRGALAQLMGKEAVCVQSMYFYKEPGSPGQAAHQDYYYIKNDPMTMIAAWTAMEEVVDIENGCLWVMPGTHKLGLLPHGAVKNLEEHESHTEETEGVDTSRQIPVPMEKGDILFFSELLIHSSTKNRSTDRWRRSYVCHYIREDSNVLHREDLRQKFPLY